MPPAHNSNVIVKGCGDGLGLDAGGKPSTLFPPGGHVDLIYNRSSKRYLKMNVENFTF